MEYCMDEHDVLPEMPVSPTGQYFNSSVLQLSILAVLESEIPMDDSLAMTLLRDVFLPINPRFSSIMTINDLIVGVIFLGTRLYMQASSSSSSSHDDQQQQLGDSNANATALVVLSTRAVSGYKTIGEMVKPNSELPWGNHFTFLHVTIPKLKHAKNGASTATDDQLIANPIRFVKKVHKMIKKKRNSAAIFLTGRMLEILRKFRGPESLAITIMSYVGKLRITIRMEKGFVDPQKFNSCIENAFNMISKATVQNDPPSNSNEV
ncbi:hypothetical protein Vadar_000204 [Vaccinium darrowii]|uniref:Uncharacterized protein n=1 Tax=Vaccinium darrowii TaxID=229202 RepID=A0ACB7Z1H8_9ERIC|nr:hypothetical protein Vadar_000204 [Vaccinium darrowii]